MSNITISKNLILNDWEPIKRVNSEGHIVYSDWKRTIKGNADECFLVWSNDHLLQTHWCLDVTGNINYSILKSIYEVFVNAKIYKETRQEESSIFLRNAFDSFLAKVNKLLIFI
jgi:hypothetical protein